MAQLRFILTCNQCGYTRMVRGCDINKKQTTDLMHQAGVESKIAFANFVTDHQAEHGCDASLPPPQDPK